MVPKLITKQKLRNEPRHISNTIIWLHTGHGSSQQWFERFHISQDSQEHECGDLKTTQYILIECVQHSDIKQKPKRILPVLILSALLNTKYELQAIVSFWKLRDKFLPIYHTAAKILLRTFAKTIVDYHFSMFIVNLK